MVLTTSECAGFLGVADCRTKKGNTVLVAQTLRRPRRGSGGHGDLYCDKSLCGQGGVASYIPLFDKGNTGEFVRAPECPAKGVIDPDSGWLLRRPAVEHPVQRR